MQRSPPHNMLRYLQATRPGRPRLGACCVLVARVTRSAPHPSALHRTYLLYPAKNMVVVRASRSPALRCTLSRLPSAPNVTSHTR